MKKRLLSAALALAVLFGSVPVPAYADDLVGGGDGTVILAEAPTDEEAPAAESTEATPEPTPAPEETPAEQAVTTWEWVGADFLREGALALPGVSETNAIDFDTVVSMLPTGITATVADAQEPAALTVTWSCGNFPEKATQGTYTFTAALPQGYTLAADAAGLAVSVILGGGETLPAATKPQGEGTQASPYQISTAAELYWFAQVVNGTVKDGTAQNAAAWATLTGDIDLTNISWVSIGSQSAPYTGTFDGNGHTLTHLTIRSDSDYQGFVGYLGAGTIQNLTLDESSSVTGGKNTGAICGWNNAGTITGCTNNGTVNGKGDLGGICGSNGRPSLTASGWIPPAPPASAPATALPPPYPPKPSAPARCATCSTAPPARASCPGTRPSGRTPCR